MGWRPRFPSKRSGGQRSGFGKVRADKVREANDGHDGTWVAHPGLVPIAKEIFDAKMPEPNQIDRKRTTCMSRPPIC